MISKRIIRRYIGSLFTISKNRILNRTFVPHPRRSIYIETSSNCNLACLFCAYPKVGPGPIMTNELFSNVVKQVVDMKFNFIWLTPMLGEIFADPRIFQKFEALEKTVEINGYSFYTNFILPNSHQVKHLCNLSKLRSIHISIYGYDKDSFVLTTQKSEKQFNLLLRNLYTFRDSINLKSLNEGIHFSIRTANDKNGFYLSKSSELMTLLNEFKSRFSATISIPKEYDSWGGEIRDEDVSPLNINITDGNNIYMRGACFKIFGEIQVKSNGLVHACACRDVDGSLIIGDIKSTPLANILSTKNKRYIDLIDSQQRGIFNSNCRSCSIYSSIYDNRGSKKNTKLKIISLPQAFTTLDH
jgi:sulfatase maturation enzyme AslB (radical SAM superfamily)